MAVGTANGMVEETPAPPPPGLDELRECIRTCPIIDNHAHNLLRLAYLRSEDFLSATCEATGEALQDHVKSLPHLRAARQLRQLYNLPVSANWDQILSKRQELLDADADGLIRKCLEGTYTILIDDGLLGPLEHYSWHNKFTPVPCKRIVRIETVAAEILTSLHQQGALPIEPASESDQATAWVVFIAAFEQSITACLADDEVVGFKSVVCYRTGLDVLTGRDDRVTEAGLQSFRAQLPDWPARQFRIQHKGMNDALVVSTCKLIEAAFQQRGLAKPFQFHTGLGDNDISLLKSNPACLQPLVQAFPTVPFVLLHSSYPYTQEAGYLATVYKNVFSDIGEVFPMVSRDGQEQIFRQVLELTPTTKILWSTDGHHFPETYWLANVQMREIVDKVLCEYVEQQDLTAEQAISAVMEILFENSNRLYSLGLRFPPAQLETPRSAESRIKRKPVSDRTKSTSLDLSFPGGTRFVSIQWLDYLGTLRSRWMLKDEAARLYSTGEGLSISQGNLGTLQDDHMTPVCDPVGSIQVQPAFNSLRKIPDGGSVKDAASVMAYFTSEDGSLHPMCPRGFCQRQADAWVDKAGLDILVGLEIEVTFCRRINDDFEPLDQNGHAWGTFTDEQYLRTFGLVSSIVDALQSMGIVVQQFHSEAGAGQYEFVLPPLPTVQAIDTLVQARQCIQQVAATQNLRATFHPMPFEGIGTAAHAHISLNPVASAPAKVSPAQAERHVFAALLAHLPALCAITLPQAVSYRRVVDDGWTGGTWVAWGSQNREVPIRKVVDGRFEVRCLDGCANMYLALGAILSLGLHGVTEALELEVQDCTVNPSKLSGEEKTALGIKSRMPRTIDEALKALETDAEFTQIIGSEIARHYLSMKKSEQEMLGEKPEDERRKWLLERY